MVARYCIVFASIFLFRVPLWKVKTNSWFQSCKALIIDSFAKNHKNNDGHGGLLNDMIIDPGGTAVYRSRKDYKNGDWWFSINHGIIH